MKTGFLRPWLPAWLVAVTFAAGLAVAQQPPGGGTPRLVTGVAVEITEVRFAPERAGDEEKPDGFSYRATVRNRAGERIVLDARTWVLVDRAGKPWVVTGSGVGGQERDLEPGAMFTFVGTHWVSGAGRAEGEFTGRDTVGRPVRVRVPAFDLVKPGESIDGLPAPPRRAGP